MNPRFFHKGQNAIATLNQLNEDFFLVLERLNGPQRRIASLRAKLAAIEKNNPSSTTQRQKENLEAELRRAQNEIESPEYKQLEKQHEELKQIIIDLNNAIFGESRKSAPDSPSVFQVVNPSPN